MERDQKVFTEKILSFESSSRDTILKALEITGANNGVHSGGLGTAAILADLGLDADALIAGLVLDLPAGSPPRLSVDTLFGAQTASLVNGVERISSLPADNKTKTIQETQNVRNMIFALTEDIRVIVICLANKLNALRVEDLAPDENRKTLARECISIYAPLADRLGIFWLKDEMEDLALKFLNREAYQQIKDLVAEKRGERNDFLKRVHETIMVESEAAGFDVEVSSRAKHFYSVYMKMRKRGKSAEEIYDLSGIRIICDSIENCYTLLGMVHRLWQPIRGCFDDYIAKPKPNGYQSLHTTVTVDDERKLEIQIRTREMQEFAENGIASHWLYKKGSSRDMVRTEDIAVVNRLKWWKQDAPDAHGADGVHNAHGAADKADTKGADEPAGSWLEEIKREMLKKSVYVFTPQGKVMKLPLGATPLDFAYQVHTAVGDHCVGAKANGAIIPLSSELKNTQVVEILTSNSAHPHYNWLEMVKSAKARGKIRYWLDHNDESFASEKNSPEKKKPALETPSHEAAATAAVPSANEREDPFVQRVSKPLESVLQVRVEDEKNLLIHFARCCNPLPGDPIIGYVSRGRGIIVHRTNCSNLSNISEFDERKTKAEWENAGSALVKRFRLDALYSANLFSEIEGAIRSRQGHLIEGRLEDKIQKDVPAHGREPSFKAKPENRLTGFFTIQLANADDVKPVMKNIRSIPGMLGIQLLN